MPGSQPSNGLAQDDMLTATAAWAGQIYTAGQIDATLEGQHFLGYPVLAAMAQRPEYRRIVETIATEMTRKWIRLVNRKGDEETQDRLDLLNDALEKFNVRDAFRKAAEGDGFFGRGHLYIALDGDQIGDELKAPIGNGRDSASKQKVRKGKLLRLQPIEAVWVNAQSYNTINPLGSDWYVPQQWYVQGREIHRDRLLTFVGREVPDFLKGAYMFGGLALTQMAQPYVANWLRTREDVSDLIAQFSVSGVQGMTLPDLLASGGAQELSNRIDMFVGARDNRGFMALGENEEFFNVSTPLGTLDKLQAQAQEQIASVCGIPLVKLLGVTPSGLNASSDGEVRVFYDFIHAYQEKLFGENLKRVLAFVQLSEFGDVDEDIGFEFEPLWQMDEAEKADVALKRTQAIMTAEPALPSDVVLRELREMGDATGAFTQITDDDIESAATEAPAPELTGTDPTEVQADPADATAQAQDAQWHEGDHPRAGNGQFGEGSSSAAAPDDEDDDGEDREAVRSPYDVHYDDLIGPSEDDQTQENEIEKAVGRIASDKVVLQAPIQSADGSVDREQMLSELMNSYDSHRNSPGFLSGDALDDDRQAAHDAARRYVEDYADAFDEGHDGHHLVLALDRPQDGLYWQARQAAEKRLADEGHDPASIQREISGQADAAREKAARAANAAASEARYSSTNEALQKTYPAESAEIDKARADGDGRKVWMLRSALIARFKREQGVTLSYDKAHATRA